MKINDWSTLKAGDDVSETKFFKLGKLPDLAFDSHKNIIQTYRSNIGEKIPPKMSCLQESLMVTNEVLVDIARQLEEDFDSRVDEKKLLLQKSRAEKLEIRRQNFEERLETKKTEKTVATAARKTIKPLGNICLLYTSPSPRDS